MKWLKSEIHQEMAIAILTLSNEKSANAFNLEMIHELTHKLKSLDQDSSVRCIIVTGEGKFFSAGGDIKKMKAREEMFSGESFELLENYEFGIQEIPRTMNDLGTPVLAMMNGPAVGAGLDFACMCDIRIGCEKVKVAESFVNLNLISGDGGTYFLPRVVGYAKAVEMSLTGKMYSAIEAKEMGLLNFLVSDDQLYQETINIAQEISSKPPMAIKLMKKALRQSYNSDLTTQLNLLAAYQGICQSSVQHQNALSSFFASKSST